MSKRRTREEILSAIKLAEEMMANGTSKSRALLTHRVPRHTYLSYLRATGAKPNQKSKKQAVFIVPETEPTTQIKLFVGTAKDLAELARYL